MQSGQISKMPEPFSAILGKISNYTKAPSWLQWAWENPNSAPKLLIQLIQNRQRFRDPNKFKWNVWQQALTHQSYWSGSTTHVNYCKHVSIDLRDIPMCNATLNKNHRLVLNSFAQDSAQNQVVLNPEKSHDIMTSNKTAKQLFHTFSCLIHLLSRCQLCFRDPPCFFV